LNVEPTIGRRFIITASFAWLLLGLLAQAADQISARDVLGKLYEVSPAVMRDFSTVTLTSEPSLLVIEADALVREEPLWDAAGRQRGTHRVATARRYGFIIRVEHRAGANSVRRNSEQDRGDYVEYSTKIILSQEKPEESTEIRAEAVFLNYQLGKELPESWRIRISKLIQELGKFDVKNRKI